ncbi:ketoacyl-ACP synthase III family protein [Streptomyces sp. NPDC059786]|uniref:ketoacyl-ACP synthase III family protein n=1 Tax=Streptomyces sp. NPDC059786 TaxID=3346946 RepID=UPI00365EF5D8
MFPPDMALLAAERALAAAATPASELTLLVFTSVHRHGHRPYWSVTSWLQDRLGCRQATPMAVSQGCNGQMLMLQVAASLLRGQGGGTALVVAADRFSASGFERFTADYDILFGDGGAAAVLTLEGDGHRTRQRPCWHVLGAHTVSAPELEALHRDASPCAATPETTADDHDIRAVKRRFVTEHGKDIISKRTRQAVGEIREVLLPSGYDLRLRHIAYPHLGRRLLEENYFPELPPTADRPLRTFGSEVGHLGSGDQIAGLDHIARTGGTVPGDRVLLLGAGAGFTWTGMLLERI